MTHPQVPFVNLARQFENQKARLTEIFQTVGKSGAYVMGDGVQKFEASVAEYCEVKHALGVGNGTDSLSMIMLALGLGAGDEVITAPNSYISSASSISNIGATPIFADIRNDLNLDPDCVKARITGKTRAIIAVHLTGKPAEMNALNAIAQQHDLFVIEDAAQAIGAMYKGRRVGGLGIAGSFSLHPLKNLNVMGDGGLITTNDTALYEKLKKLRNHGMIGRDSAEFWGMNSRLDTLQAEIGLFRLEHLDSTTARFREIADLYRNGLSDLVGTPFDKEHEYCVYHNFIIQVEERERLMDYLARAGVETKIHYPIQLHLQPAAAALGYKEGDFPVAERISKKMMSLPIYPELHDTEVGYIVNCIRNFYNQVT